MRSLKSAEKRTAREKRTAPRYPLARMAKIQLGYDAQPAYCIITDISDGGVRLHVDGFDVPDEFVLLLSGHRVTQESKYKVVWRAVSVDTHVTTGNFTFELL